MTTYKEIRGTQIEVVSSDPSNPVEGQVWYNSTDQALKGRAVTTTGSWSTVNSMNTARKSLGGAGTATSAVAFGGNPSPNSALTESWNGTNWSEVADLNTARIVMGSAGASNTAALAFGGTSDPPNRAQTENWNGSSWTEVNDLNTARQGMGSAGVVATAALAFAGYTSTTVAITESWNGTNWTEVNDLNEARYNIRGSGPSNSAQLVFGGQPGTGPSTGKTEEWNGTNWSEQNDLNTARVGAVSATAGSPTSNLAFGGEGPPQLGSTEEWVVGTGVTRTFTDSQDL